VRLMFVGDVVGKSGRNAIVKYLPDLRTRLSIDVVVVNGENATHGFGLNEEHYRLLRDHGADVVTLGNHAFDQRETLVYIEREQRLIRPINWPKGCPGRGSTMIETSNGKRVLVINAMGRVTIEPALDDPFPAVDRELELCQIGQACDAVMLDFHAEATSEKMAMGHFCDGRASLVVGTHTHAPTADHHVMRGGTAYMTDAGMTGDYDSVIGMDKAEPLQRFLRKLPIEKMKPAEGEATLCGVVVETDDRTGLAKRVAPVRVGGGLAQTDFEGW
jgi:2',3'-cyclic-nucleotide 2'-phosphodiesterase